MLGRAPRRGGSRAGAGWGGPLLLLLLLPQPLWLRPTRRDRTASPRRVPSNGGRVGDGSEMRVARWVRVRGGRRSTAAPRRDKGGRGAARYRPSDPGMRLRSRVDLETAGEQKACGSRDRLPGSWQRALLSGLQKDLEQLVAPVHSSSTALAAASGAAMPAKHGCVTSDFGCCQAHSTASVSWFGRGGDLVQLAERLEVRASSSAWRRAGGVRSASAKEREHDVPDRPSPGCWPSAPREASCLQAACEASSRGR